MKFEEKIIKGIADGLIKPSEITLGQSDFEDSEMALLFTSAQKMESEGLQIDLEGLFDYTTKLFSDSFWCNINNFGWSGYLSKSVI